MSLHSGRQAGAKTTLEPLGGALDSKRIHTSDTLPGRLFLAVAFSSSFVHTFCLLHIRWRNRRQQHSQRHNCCNKQRCLVPYPQTQEPLLTSKFLIVLCPDAIRDRRQQPDPVPATPPPSPLAPSTARTRDWIGSPGLHSLAPAEPRRLPSTLWTCQLLLLPAVFAEGIGNHGSATTGRRGGRAAVGEFLCHAIAYGSTNAVTAQSVCDRC